MTKFDQNENRKLKFLLPGRRYMTAGQWKVRTSVYRVISFVILIGICSGLFVMDRKGVFGRYSRSDIATYNDKKFRVIQAVDGDTIDIDQVDGINLRTRIRLWGVDTPETKKPDHPVEHFGPEASEFTRRMTLNKNVRLELLPHDTRDKYGRLLAYVYLPDGRMLNALLVEEGYAFADPRFEHPYMREFKQKMRKAKENKKGLWKDPHPNDLPYYMKKR